MPLICCCRSVSLPCKPAKVPCADAIKQARVTRIRSKGLKALSAVNLKKSEAGCHRVFKSFGSSLEIPISRVKLPSTDSFPYVKFEHWLHYLVKNDSLECLVGVKDVTAMQQVLKVFWERYQEVHSSHVIYTRTDIRREMCIPVLWHGDEGRGLKKKQIMILSTHGFIGAGTLKTENLKESFGEPENPLGLNFVGHTIKTHYLFAAMPVNLYNESPDSFYRLLEVQSEEFTRLFDEGTVIEGRRFYVACLGIKGDSPWLSKAGRFQRNFARRPIKYQSRKPCQGICHLCLAGKEDYEESVPYEELGVEWPRWRSTCGLVRAYSVSETSPLLSIPFDQRPAGSETYFHYDLFHNFHLGLGKNFISSAVCMVMELIEDSIERSFQQLTSDFLEYCRHHKESPYHKKLTAVLFGVNETFKDCPDGGWSKGDFTRLLHKWFASWCSRRVVGKTQDPVYLMCVSKPVVLVKLYGFLLVHWAGLSFIPSNVVLRFF